MARLTEKDKQGNWCLKGLPWESIHTGKTITQDIWEKLYGALCKLKDYEETGLNPCEADNLLEKLRWIPVTESLPDIDEFVLVIADGKLQSNITCEKAVFLAQYYSDEGWVFDGWPECESLEVKAWMQVPKYKE